MRLRLTQMFLDTLQALDGRSLADLNRNIAKLQIFYDEVRAYLLREDEDAWVRRPAAHECDGGRGYYNSFRFGEDFEVTVGSNGDFPTINEALEYLCRLFPNYIASRSTNAVATARLLPGFVMAEQVLIKGLDLGWITIVGDDDETTVRRDALTLPFMDDETSRTSIYPAFGVADGGVAPRIGHMFRMDDTGEAEYRIGMAAHGSGSTIHVLGGKEDSGTLSTYGFKDADINLYVVRGATAMVNGATLTGGISYGVYASRMAVVNAYGSNARRADDVDGEDDFVARRGSIISAVEALGGTNIEPNEVSDMGIIFK